MFRSSAHRSGSERQTTKSFHPSIHNQYSRRILPTRPHGGFRQAACVVWPCSEFPWIQLARGLCYKYHAGIWESDIIKGHLWLNNSQVHPRPSNEPYRAPTWSWAFYNKSWCINFPLLTTHCLKSLKTVQLSLHARKSCHCQVLRIRLAKLAIVRSHLVVPAAKFSGGNHRVEEQ
jgi:hypothetical protein